MLNYGYLTYHGRESVSIGFERLSPGRRRLVGKADFRYAIRKYGRLITAESCDGAVKHVGAETPCQAVMATVPVVAEQSFADAVDMIPAVGLVVDAVTPPEITLAVMPRAEAAIEPVVVPAVEPTAPAEFTMPAFSLDDDTDAPPTLRERVKVAAPKLSDAALAEVMALLEIGAEKPEDLTSVNGVGKVLAAKILAAAKG